MIVFFFLSILITGERASALIFIIGVLCYYLFDFRNIKKFIFICSIFIFSLILMVIFNKNTNYKFLHTSYQIGILKYFDHKIENIPENFSDYEKRNFFDSKHGAHFLTAIEIWKQNKFIGIGAKTLAKNAVMNIMKE